jgi:hypothetical protein
MNEEPPTCVFTTPVCPILGGLKAIETRNVSNVQQLLNETFETSQDAAPAFMIQSAQLLYDTEFQKYNPLFKEYCV